MIDVAAHQVPLNRTEAIIQWLLRVMGLIVVLAVIPVFFSASWIEYFHRLMGLGDVPQQPIFWFLARSLSLLYFAHGVVVLALSTDIRRYWPLIKLLCWLNLFLGTILIGIDVSAPMPWWWTLGEGPGIIAGAILLLTLVRRTEKHTGKKI